MSYHTALPLHVPLVIGLPRSLEAVIALQESLYPRGGSSLVRLCALSLHTQAPLAHPWAHLARSPCTS